MEKFNQIGIDFWPSSLKKSLKFFLSAQTHLEKVKAVKPDVTVVDEFSLSSQNHKFVGSNTACLDIGDSFESFET